MSNLGIEFISVFGMAPVAMVELAARLGCGHISIGFNQTEFDPYGYPRYSLRDDVALRRELKAALAANGVTISLGENLMVQAGADMREQWLADLEIFAELGISRANSVSFEPDLQRNIDQYGLLAETSAAFGVRTLLEFVPIFGVPDLPTALTVAEKVAHPNLGLMMDTMHIGRTGATTSALRAVPPDLIGYIQLCDAPVRPTNPDYMDEAMFERMVPGEGELPLADYLGAMPRDRIVSLELPVRSEAERGIPPEQWLRRAVDATRAILASLA